MANPESHGRPYDTAYLAPDPLGPQSLTQASDRLIRWFKEARSDGLSYLRNQAAYEFIQSGIDMINGHYYKPKVQSLSDLTMELTVRNLKELNAAQTNIRIIPSFKTEIAEFRTQNSIQNRCFMAWQQMTFADRKIRKAWQFATGAGTGYLGVRYDPNYHYKGRGDIVLDAYGPLDVLPVGLPHSHDLQKAYCTILKVRTPFHEALRMTPEPLREKLNPSKEANLRRGTVEARSVRYASAVLKRWGPSATLEAEPTPWETVDIYYCYIDDDSINDTGHLIEMGDPGTSWAYTVPYIGQEIKGKKAKREDCLIYPNKRLVKFANDDLCLNPKFRDQVNPYWDGRTPLVQLRADDFPWTFLGFPLTRAGASYEKANTEMMRGMVDACNVRLSPPRAFDRNTMAQALAQSLNTRVPNQVLGLDMAFGGEQIKPLLPFQFYEFPSYIPELVKANEARITHQMGVADAQAMARARQLPAGDSIDKIMEALGPVIRDQSRNMEESIRAMGEMWKSRFFQFITAPRRMELIGPDGLAEEDFDYDPGTLIPAAEQTVEMRKKRDDEGSGYYEAFESKFKEANTEGGDRFVRARWHMNNFTFSVVPYSLHELNSITRKLFHLQLMRSGFPVDWWTLSELFDIKNFGEYPKVPDPDNPGGMKSAETILERWLAQKQITARMAAAEAQAAGGGGGGGGGAPSQAGRPPSGKAAPTLEQKSGDGGTRSTIRESSK